MITVGAIQQSSTPTIEEKTNFSKTGPGITVFAPGDFITGAVSNTNTLGPTGDGYPQSTYPLNTNYLNIKVSGTSQASPQVTGVLATLLQARPYLNQTTALQTIQQISTQNRITNVGSGYTSFYSLQGANNNYLYNPFNSGSTVTVANTSAGSSTIYGQL
jgi:subtilisin family serine protease